MDHDQENPVKPKRRRFQFGLKSLFVLPVIVGLLLVLYIYWVDWKNHRSYNLDNENQEAVFWYFVEDLKANRLDHAYDSTSARFKKRTTRDHFDALIRSYSDLRQLRQSLLHQAHSASYPEANDGIALAR